MDDDSSENIIIWIFSFIILVSLVFLLLLKVQQVSSNQEFFSEYHSFSISKIITTSFLDEGYFRIPYTVGKLENINFKLKKENENNFFILENNNIPYKNILFVPENSEVKNFNNVPEYFYIEKNNNILNFKLYNKCTPTEDSFKIEDLKYNFDLYKYDEKKYHNIVIVSPESKNFCNVYYGLKNFYSKSNVLLLRIPDDEFKTFSNKDFFIIVE